MRTFSIQLPLDPLAVGQVVDRAAWPAHITLIGNFRAHDAAPVEAVLARSAPEVPPIRAVVGEEAWFGPGGTVLVDLVEVPLLRSLHGALLDGWSRPSTGSRCSCPTTPGTPTGLTGR